MATRIGVTVGDGGLVEQNAQQQAASRQGFVVRKGQERAATEGGRQRAQEREAEGLDPATGLILPSSLTGANRNNLIRRVDQQPAAYRRINKIADSFITYLGRATRPYVDGIFYEYTNILYYRNIEENSLVFGENGGGFASTLTDGLPFPDIGVYGEPCAIATSSPTSNNSVGDGAIYLQTGSDESSPVIPNFRTATYARDVYVDPGGFANAVLRCTAELEGLSYSCFVIFTYKSSLATSTVQMYTSSEGGGSDLFLVEEVPNTHLAAGAWNRISLTVARSRVYVHANGTLIFTGPNINPRNLSFITASASARSSAPYGYDYFAKVGSARFSPSAVYGVSSYPVRSLLGSW